MGARPAETRRNDPGLPGGHREETGSGAGGAGVLKRQDALREPRFVPRHIPIESPFAFEVYGAIPIIDSDFQLTKDWHTEDAPECNPHRVAHFFQTDGCEAGIVLTKAGEDQCNALCARGLLHGALNPGNSGAVVAIHVRRLASDRGIDEIGRRPGVDQKQSGWRAVDGCGHSQMVAHSNDTMETRGRRSRIQWLIDVGGTAFSHRGDRRNSS